jgi:hypothetical protein
MNAMYVDYSYAVSLLLYPCFVMMVVKRDDDVAVQMFLPFLLLLQTMIVRGWNGPDLKMMLL